MRSAEIIRASDVVDAVFVEEMPKPMRRIGVGDTSTLSTPIAVTPAQIGFIALGSAVAGFVIGYAISKG